MSIFEHVDSKRVNTDFVKTVTAAAVTGSDPANPSDDYDSSYLSPVTIGSTTVNLDFDTGSADL